MKKSPISKRQKAAFKSWEIRRAKAQVQTVQARYDAADPWWNWGNRAFIWKAPTTVRQEILPTARRELLKISRTIYDNSPLICGLFERIISYVIGSGIRPFSACSDEKFAKQANAAWKKFAQSPMLRSEDDWNLFCEQIYRVEMRDGDCGVILTANEFGEPRLVAVEGLEIGSDHINPVNILDLSEFDGVKFDKLLRPIAYQILGDSPVEVDAKNFVHVFNPLRPNQVRGVPLLSSALYTAQDVQEILNLEKLAVKEFASHTDIIKTKDGNVPQASVRPRFTTTTDVNGTSTNKTEYYREVFSPTAKVLQRGDEWEAFVAERPSPAWQGFMDYLSQSICLAARIPPSVLLQIKVGGADTRRDLAAAARSFEREQCRLAHKFTKIWKYVLSCNKELMAGAPDDALEVRWQHPKSITVDAGREAQADRDDVAAGLMSLEEYWSRYGLEPEEQEDKIIKQALLRKQKLAEAGLTLDEFAMLLDPTTAAVPTTIQMEPDGDEDEQRNEPEGQEEKAGGVE